MVIHDRCAAHAALLVPVQLDVGGARGGRGAHGMDVPPTSTPLRHSRRAVAELAEPRARGPTCTGGRCATREPASPVAGNDGQGDTRRYAFPAVPDRWLVVRISETPGARAVRGWVLRAGDAVPDVVPLDEWMESEVRRGEMEQPLTALGHGDPAFTAYFDNVLGRMSFHDALEDVAAGPIAYLVCGWFADAGMDPLASAPVDSIAAFERRLVDSPGACPRHLSSGGHGRRTVRAAARSAPLDSPPSPALAPAAAGRSANAAGATRSLSASHPRRRRPGIEDRRTAGTSSIDVGAGGHRGGDGRGHRVRSRPISHGAGGGLIRGMLASSVGCGRAASNASTGWPSARRPAAQPPSGIWQTRGPAVAPPRPGAAQLSGVLVAARRSRSKRRSSRIGVLATDHEARRGAGTRPWRLVRCRSALNRWFRARTGAAALGARRSARHGATVASIPKAAWLAASPAPACRCSPPPRRAAPSAPPSTAPRFWRAPSTTAACHSSARSCSRSWPCSTPARPRRRRTRWRRGRVPRARPCASARSASRWSRPPGGRCATATSTATGSCATAGSPGRCPRRWRSPRRAFRGTRSMSTTRSRCGQRVAPATTGRWRRSTARP